VSKKLSVLIAILMACTLLASGCAQTARYEYEQPLNIVDDAYRTWYEVFVPSFYDADGDGTGDLAGLTVKLDYLNDGKGGGLGITGIWLMPIMPSPSYHKYDVTDYENVDPSYGTLGDLEQLATECHKRGIRLIIDYEFNHTSSQHPWFLSATQAIRDNPDNPGSNPYLAYYNFVHGTPASSGYAPVGTTGWYYEAEFTSSMPDLNLDNTAVRAELEKSAQFWLGLGVDGFRLDAVQTYYGTTSSGDIDRNIALIDWFTGVCQSVDPDAYIVGEVWSNATTIADYYRSDATSFFAFPFAQATGLVASTLNGTGSNASAQSFCKATAAWQGMLQEYDTQAIDAPFIGNHDTARPAGFFSGDLQKTKMAAGLYLTMSGGPFVYYGEEIGMTGSRTDPDKRGPMLWSDTVTTGMTAGPPGMEPAKVLFPAEDVQDADALSLLNYYRRALRLRNENPEIARGTVSVLGGIADPEVCAVAKTWNGSRIILVINTSNEAKILEFSRTANRYAGIRGYLSATGAAPTLRGDRLTLPPMSIVVLK
jgi:glycosidase